ncbi:MAG: ATPase [Oscillospiraceae bacterium]|jgi:V/A-type H+-transporting ATPase subunit I|nr:ATPase [Oscillospiraceae bacterium]
MAITKMKLLRVAGDMADLDRAIEICCENGEFHIDQAMSYFSDKRELMAISEENPYNACLTKLHDLIAGARLKVMPPGDDKKEFDIEEITNYVDTLSEKLNNYSATYQQLTADIENCSRSIELLGHFSDFGLNLEEVFSCKFVKIRFGRMPEESFDKLKYYSDNPYIVAFPCSVDRDYVWGFYCAPEDKIAEADRIFHSLYWERLWVPSAAGTPEEAISEISVRKVMLEAQREELDAQKAALWEKEKGDDLQYIVRISEYLAYVSEKKAKFDLRRNAVKYSKTSVFVLLGWLPEEECGELFARLDKIDGLYCTLEVPESDMSESPPVKLKNRKLFKPFEFFVEMYGLPSYSEVDPTPFVAMMYFLVFGMMFSDVGQGLVLSLFSWFVLWKKMKMPLGKPIALCGISSTFFGFVFGSVFGFEHWLNPFWEWFGSKTGIVFHEVKPINLENPDTVQTLILSAVGIGAFLVACAILMSIYSKLKQRKLALALFDQNGVVGLVFYCALLAGIVGEVLFKIHMLTIPYIILLIVVPLVLLYFKELLIEHFEGTHHKKPEKMGEYLMQSFFELFEVVLNYASNTISFLRIGAFILIHAGMMKVVFTLAEMTSGAAYVIIVILGNIIIMGLEALLVGIQSLRLVFYEMFSRFFDGSGRAYKPIKLGERLSSKK